jgi:hypothetical protein
MCYALLTTCTHCSWTLHISHVLCEHAEIHQLSRQECPSRMKRTYAKIGVCDRCEEKWEGMGPDHRLVLGLSDEEEMQTRETVEEDGPQEHGRYEKEDWPYKMNGRKKK